MKHSRLALPFWFAWRLSRHLRPIRWRSCIVPLCLLVASAACARLPMMTIALPLSFGLATCSLFFIARIWLTASMSIAAAAVGLAIGTTWLFFGLVNGFEWHSMQMVARTQGHVQWSKYGHDFAEYPQVRTRINADPLVVCTSAYAWGMAVATPVSESFARGEPSDELSQTETRVVGLKGLDPDELARCEHSQQPWAAAAKRGEIVTASTGRRPSILLGEPLSRELGAQVGSIVHLVAGRFRSQKATHDPASDIQHGEFLVAGTFRTGSQDFDRSLAIVHLKSAQALFYGQDRIAGFEIELAPAAFGQEGALLRKWLEIENGDRRQPLYRGQTWNENPATTPGFRQARTVLWFFGASLMVASAMSSAACLLLLLRRRRSSFAVLTALGARPVFPTHIAAALGIWIGIVGCALAGCWLLAIVPMLNHLDLSNWMPDLSWQGSVLRVDVATCCTSAILAIVLLTGVAWTIGRHLQKERSLLSQLVQQ